jgi:uncharacterized protein
MRPVSPRDKLAALEGILREMGGAVIAYSGGVDSSLLAVVAGEVLGQRSLAVTALSETYPAAEAELARELARRAGFRFREIETRELENASFRTNPPDRCYHCKRELFAKLAEIAREEGLPFVADGSNTDDLSDFRPGERAAEEFGVRHPLREAGLTKADIREISRAKGIPGWDRPPSACLASRVPYGEPIEPRTLARIAAAEEFLRARGYRVCRVRSHRDVARIEVDRAEILRLAGSDAQEVSARLRELGFRYVTLDLEGYRTGSMNEALGVVR